MKIQLDFDTKTIRLAEETNLEKLINWCKEHLDNLELWSIDVNTQVTWTQPIIYQPTMPYPWEVQNPYVYGNSGDFQPHYDTVTSNVYNLEIND